MKMSAHCCNNVLCIVSLASDEKEKIQQHIIKSAASSFCGLLLVVQMLLSAFLSLL